MQVGLGYRSQAFKRVLADLDGFECAGLVLRRVLAAEAPVHTDLDRCLEEVRPDFVLGFTPAAATPAVMRTAVEHGVPVLVETPPAREVSELDRLADLAASGLVQVAEQYPLMPGHAARLAAVGRGLIGEVSQVQVSSTQTYHAMALIRAYLGCRPAQTGPDDDHGGETVREVAADAAPDLGADDGSDPVREPVGGPIRPGTAAVVRAARFSGPLVNPLTRAGWTSDDAPHPAATILASVDFGDGRSGVYDFTDNQTRNLLRTRRLLVRGSHGEISGDQVVRLAGHHLITTTYLNRRQTGHDLDLNGYCTYQITLGDEVLWTNPWPDRRWNDDELAVAELLRRLTDWLRGEGPAPYPLAEAVYDTRLGLAIDQAVEEDQPVALA